jgi:hypothetical protein
MMVEISNGELLDKLSILKIKLDNISEDGKLKNIRKEFDILNELSNEFLKQTTIMNLFNELLDVNKKLWDVEDFIRHKEKLKEFDEEFVFYARNVYITNDLRAEIKRKINDITNSEIVEEKSYERY